MEPLAAAQRVLALAREAGLPLAAITDAAPVARHADFMSWLGSGYAADMEWLERDAAPREGPRALLPDARSVLVVALSYAHPSELIPPDRLVPRGQIARYARGADYHHELKQRLRRLGDTIDRELAPQLGRGVRRLVCVDTAPLLERELAQRAGLGFVGKSAMLIGLGAGSYLSLGALILDVELAPGSALGSRCGTCTSCLTACPTGAFAAPYVVDARRCIAYLTIENRGPIPRELRSAVGARIFGCDVCQEVCPFNAGQAATFADAALAPRPGYGAPDLLRLLRIGAAQFRKWQQRSALRRIHRPELLRNVAVALGNVGGEESVAALGEALDEPSPLVRGHVAWALGEIARRGHRTERVRAMLLSRREVEEDEGVRAELDDAAGRTDA